jgi:hypothetical protein
MKKILHLPHWIVAYSQVGQAIPRDRDVVDEAEASKTTETSVLGMNNLTTQRKGLTTNPTTGHSRFLIEEDSPEEVGVWEGGADVSLILYIPTNKQMIKWLLILIVLILIKWKQPLYLNLPLLQVISQGEEVLEEDEVEGSVMEEGEAEQAEQRWRN